MAFTAQDVAKLREQTGAGMMDCKKALTHTDGNMDKAAEYLREQGVNIAAKKANRLASEGIVSSFISKDGKIGALVEINCESDFVAKSDDFIKLCNNVANHIALTNPSSVEVLYTEKYALDKTNTILELVNAAIAKIGEKITIRRFDRIEKKNDGLVESYIHMGGKIGVLLELASDKDLKANEEVKNMCHDIAMHIAAFSPSYVKSEEVPTAELEKEKEILKAQALNEGKPVQVIDKMVEGRVKKYYKEICLIYQDFAKDPSITVTQLLSNVGAKVGANLSVVKFDRFVMGEGLEKKNENLADEVAKIQNK